MWWILEGEFVHLMCLWHDHDNLMNVMNTEAWFGANTSAEAGLNGFNGSRIYIRTKHHQIKELGRAIVKHFKVTWRTLWQRDFCSLSLLRCLIAVSSWCWSTTTTTSSGFRLGSHRFALYRVSAIQYTIQRASFFSSSFLLVAIESVVECFHRLVTDWLSILPVEPSPDTDGGCRRWKTRNFLCRT